MVFFGLGKGRKTEMPAPDQALPGRSTAMAVPDRHYVNGNPLTPPFPAGLEVVRVVFDPTQVSYGDLLRLFWESHNPTQGMRQGNDVGTQYRSGIYVYSEAQRQQAESSREAYQQALQGAGYGLITTEILPAPEFYYAEAYHQQYLAKNPGGYCGLGGTQVACPV
jgi:peptide-methionine (S)-S-oxide reductase